MKLPYKHTSLPADVLDCTACMQQAVLDRVLLYPTSVKHSPSNTAEGDTRGFHCCQRTQLSESNLR